jgi:hypothetical protein
MTRRGNPARNQNLGRQPARVRLFERGIQVRAYAAAIDYNVDHVTQVLSGCQRRQQ